MSSKGQIVIPAEMRKNFREGDKLVIIQQNGRLILKKVSEIKSKFSEDIEFARRTEEAYRRIKKGLGKTMTAEEFLKELAKW